MQTVVAWRLDELPAVDQAEFLQFLDSNLGGAGAGKEEQLELARIQVAVVMESGEEDQIPLRDVMENLDDVVLGENERVPEGWLHE